MYLWLKYTIKLLLLVLFSLFSSALEMKYRYIAREIVNAVCNVNLSFRIPFTLCIYIRSIGSIINFQTQLQLYSPLIHSIAEAVLYIFTWRRILLTHSQLSNHYIHFSIAILYTLMYLQPIAGKWIVQKFQNN